MTVISNSFAVFCGTDFLEKMLKRGQLMAPCRLDAAGSTDGNFLSVSGERLIEGQVIELEDGTTAYIHQVTVQKGENHEFRSFFLEGFCRCNCSCLCSNSQAPLLALALRSPYRCGGFFSCLCFWGWMSRDIEHVVSCKVFSNLTRRQACWWCKQMFQCCFTCGLSHSCQSDRSQVYKQGQ